MKSFQYKNLPENIGAAADHIRDAARGFGLAQDIAELRAKGLERMLSFLAEEYPSDMEVTIEVFRSLGDIRLRMFFTGEKLDLCQLARRACPEHAEIGGVKAAKLRKIFANCFGASAMSFKYTESGVNVFSVLLGRASYRALIVLMTALFAGVAVGLGIRAFLPEAAGMFVTQNFFTSVTDIFVSCVKMLIGPLMFFTISSSIASYSDLSALGRMGGKLITRYLLNALIAMALSAAVLLALKPGMNSGMTAPENLSADSVSVAAAAAETTVSIRDTLVNFFPSSFFGAFVSGKMMQIIVISVLLGIAAGLLSAEYREGIHRFLSCGNQVFCKMMDLVMLLLPVSVFCSMANTMIVMGMETLALLIKWVLALVLVFALMAAVYVAKTAVFARVSPKRFLTGYSEAIIGTFALGSCNASMPICMKTAEEKLGVPHPVAALTMPIGVSIHCACNCAFYLVSLFFLANVFKGTFVSPLAHPMIFFSVFVLGIGAPSVSGAGPICVAMLLPELGLPVWLITLIIGLDPFVSMFKSACSCIEDASVTLAVARSEKKL